MEHRSKRLLWTSALVAPWLSLTTVSGLSGASAQTVDVERSEQDNVSFVGATDGEIERLIHQFGPTTASEDGASGEGNGPLHRIADEIVAHYEKRNYKLALKVLGDNPGVREVRPEIRQLEAWSHYHSGHARTAMKQFQDLYVETPSAEHAAGVIYSGMRAEFYSKTDAFAREHGGPLAQILKPGEKAPVGAPKDSIEKTQVDFLNGWLRAAVKYKKFETADKVARLLGFEGIDEIKAEMLIGYGWQAHKAKSYSKAADYFGQIASLAASMAQGSEALYGRALSLRDAGEIDKAQALLAQAKNPDARMLALIGEITLAQGRSAYDAEDYPKSLSMALSVKSPDNEPRAAWMLEGWSLLKLERAEDAAGVFVPAYRKLPDQESADGATASLMALGRRDELVQLADEIDGPLIAPTETPPTEEPGEPQKPWVMSAGERAFHRGDFALAVSGATAFKPEVAETLAPWLGLTLNYKFRDGDEGLGQLAMSGSKVSFDLTDKTLHLRAEVEVLHLDTGGVPEQPILSGSRAPGDLRPFGQSIDETVFQPSIHFRKEGARGFEASVGLSPLEGEVHPTLTGHFDFVQNHKGARYSVGAHRNSIYESLLSIAGMQDTVTGQSWGRVIETGIHGAVYQPVAGNLAFTGEGRWGERSGVHVDTNQTRFFNLGAVYSFDAKGFTYLSVGPSFSQTEFDKNRSFFTFGHGGYYSPAEAQNVSLNLNFLTDENKNWIARGSLAAGYEEAESDAAPFYPLDVQAGDPVPYAASSSQGSAFSAQAVLARRLNDALILEAGAYGIQTEDYSEAAAFLKLRVSFGKRTKVWRTDLTEDLYRKYH